MIIIKTKLGYYIKDGPSLPRHDDLRGKPRNEVGFSLNKGDSSTPSLGLGLSLKLDTEGKPDATLFGKPGPLPGLAINKEKNPYSVRGKKIIARNLPSGIPLNCTVANPFQVFSSKLASLSASAITSSIHGPEASPCSSFKFMASNEDGLGINNGWGGDRNSSGDQRRVQSKDHVHDAVVQPKGKDSLGFEAGGAGMLSDSHSKKGSDNEVDEDDRMVPEEEGETKSSF